jgi:ADP-heptose:LPS heptosyltransferase
MKYGKPVLENNPYIDEFLVHDEKILNVDLDKHWERLAKKYDRFINLSESIEKTLLKQEGGPEFTWSHMRRHAECNVNYYDRTLELGGYPNVKGLNGELFFTQEEEHWASNIMNQNPGKFTILWSLSGSSFHKTYPFSETVAKEFLDTHPDSVIYTIGGNVEGVLEWEHNRTIRRCGAWSIRKSLIMTKYADLVIGPETGVLNAAGCFDTPKILFLSHSSRENLSKHWNNCEAIVPFVMDAPCHPCHQLHYTLLSCPQREIGTVFNMKTKKHENITAPVCVASIPPDRVLAMLNKAHDKWIGGKNGALHREGNAAILC